MAATSSIVDDMLAESEEKWFGLVNRKRTKIFVPIRTNKRAI